MYNNLGDRLRILRESKNLTQPELAEKIRLSYSSIQKHEAGEGLNKNSFQKYLNFYGCDRDWLLTGKGKPFKEALNGNPGLKAETRSIEQTLVDYNDEFIEAVAGLKKIYDSNDPILIPAIAANIRAFSISIQRERMIHEQNEKICELEKKCEELDDRIDSIEGTFSEKIKGGKAA